mmetsp:Transcript_5217/g.7834  ORF Transcript_5217/g.7834 Transcript_5217/m.7834 type:complete len:285 (-) Transcript_5217:717-1571(-)
MGKQEMNSFFSSLNHPIIPNRSWERGGQRVGNLISKVWEKKQEENLVEELVLMKKEEGWKEDEQKRVKLEATFDGTWSTRGYSSNLGFASYFGVFSHKPLFTSHRCKICLMCQSAKRKQKTPLPHICSKNWSKSSGAMEAAIAIEGAKFLAKSVVVEGKIVSVRVGTLVGDGDSKIDAHLKENLSGDLLPNRFFDTNHIAKNFTKKLYKMKENNAYGKILSKTVIQAFKKSFSIEIRREGTWEEKKKKLENIPCHFFNKGHDNCGEWCKEKKKKRERFQQPPLQ